MASMRYISGAVILAALHVCEAAISPPTSCEITQSTFQASNVRLESISVTSFNKKLAFDLEVNFQATCTSDTGDTSWASATGVRQMTAKGIEGTMSRSDTIYYGIEVKDAQDNGEFKFGERWDGDCVKEEFKGTWSAGTTTCDSTSGSISGADCIALFAAAEASICWSIASPKVCVDTMAVSGSLSASAQIKLVAAGSVVSSTPTSVLDMSQYYECSGTEAEVKEASDSAALSTSKSSLIWPSGLLILLGLL